MNNARLSSPYKSLDVYLCTLMSPMGKKRDIENYGEQLVRKVSLYDVATLSPAVRCYGDLTRRIRVGAYTSVSHVSNP